MSAHHATGKLFPGSLNISKNDYISKNGKQGSTVISAALFIYVSKICVQPATDSKKLNFGAND